MSASPVMYTSSLDITTSYEECDATKPGYVTGSQRSIYGLDRGSDANQRHGTTSGTATEQENSYRLSPAVIFPCQRIKDILTDVFRECLQGVTYKEELSNALTCHLTEKSKDIVKWLTRDQRYKIVAFVTIGQKGVSTITAASQCVWNDLFDRRVEVKYDNGHVFVMALVFAFYVE